MPVPKWLDRLWLWLIACSFLLIVPAFVAMWAERVGWPIVGGFILVMLLLGFSRGLPGHSR